jgi:hypothetical protein
MERMGAAQSGLLGGHSGAGRTFFAERGANVHLVLISELVEEPALPSRGTALVCATRSTMLAHENGMGLSMKMFRDVACLH